MARDQKTTFEHQRALHEDRPLFTMEKIGELAKGNKLRVGKSFHAIVGPDEFIAAVSTDAEEIYVRINPDLALNLAMTMLKVGNDQGWWKLDLQQIDQLTKTN